MMTSKAVFMLSFLVRPHKTKEGSHMTIKPEGAFWLDAKWLVIISAVAAFVVVLDYDHRLGIAAGVLLASTALVWIALALWFSAGIEPQSSPARVLADRFEQQARRRLLAEQRARENAARQVSGAKQASDLR
jgi:hypothetical protein